MFLIDFQHLLRKANCRCHNEMRYTHLQKQQFDCISFQNKEKRMVKELLHIRYQYLTEEQRKNIPILGSFQPSKFGNVETVVAEEVKATQTTQAKPQPSFDDIPF